MRLRFKADARPDARHETRSSLRARSLRLFRRREEPRQAAKALAVGDLSCRPHQPDPAIGGLLRVHDRSEPRGKDRAQAAAERIPDLSGGRACTALSTRRRANAITHCYAPTRSFENCAK